VANKPILFYVIEDLIEAGITDIGIIVGPNKDQVISTVTSHDWDAHIEFIDQDKPLGIAHTIKISKDFLADDSFLMYLGDNILKEGVVDHVKDFLNSGYDSSIMINKVPNPEEFGIAILNQHNDVTKLVEKPKNPPNNNAVIGVYMFTSEIHNAVKDLKPSQRGQLEITDAIQWLIDNGRKVKSSFVNNWWKDTGKPEDILHANRLILDDIQSKNNGTILDSDIRGRVEIGKNSIIEKSCLVKGPAMIGKNCHITKSYIGPYTSIGDDCTIVDSEIEDSVVLNGCKVSNAGRIVDSLLGKEVSIEKNNSPPKGRRLIIGDNSEIHL
jgi:glucose-1-phosphate thymidylyltransferase